LRSVIAGERETDGIIVNPQVPHGSIALQVPFAQLLSGLCFCCLQQPLCALAAQQDADTLSCKVFAIPDTEDRNRIHDIRKKARYFIIVLNFFYKNIVINCTMPKINTPLR